MLKLGIALNLSESKGGHLMRKFGLATAAPARMRRARGPSIGARLHLTGLVVLAALALAAIPAAASSSGWSVVPTPNPTAPTGFLNGDSCASSTLCIAVGQYTTSTGVGSVQVQRWDGSRWTTQTASNPSGGVSSSLNGVSCLTASFCMGVGDSFNGSGVHTTLTERWDGKKWSVLASPNPAGGGDPVFTSVSCTSSSSCEAMGAIETDAGFAPLAERWDGSAWTIQAMPNPGGNSIPSQVNCASASECEAVGNTITDSGGEVPLAERWNGTNWSVQPTPNPANGGFLNAVSCTSATSCIAVGHNGDFSATLAESWDGKKWRMQSMPSVPGAGGFAVLNGVSCRSAAFCEAVGVSGAGTLAEAWDGQSWTVQPSPSPQGGFPPSTQTVDCPTTSSCIAVGPVFNDSSGNAVSFSLQYDGSTWQLRPTADPTGAASSAFGYLAEGNAVACPSTPTCIAVGAIGERTPLVERSNGAGWSIQPTPQLPGPGGLSGVSCTSPSACTAIGSYTDPSGVFDTLAERWNGSTWAIQPTPNPPDSGESHLFAVSCSSSSSCTAVGEQHPSDGTTAGLAEHWDGSAWSIQSIPTPTGDQFVSMTGVSCPTATFCMAVAFSDSGALAEEWNGSSWSIVPSVPLGTDSGLASISCTSPSFCMAAGGSAFSGGFLAEAWNGATWSLQSIPIPPNIDDDFLTGVSCTDSSHCTAVGQVFGNLPVAERWDGTSWTSQSTPSLFAFGTDPPSVACASVSVCTLVTGHSLGPNETTLAEQWNGSGTGTTSATVQATSGAPAVDGSLGRPGFGFLARAAKAYVRLRHAQAAH